MMVPSVHLNGTSKAELIRQLVDAGEAIEAAISAMGKAMPNGRDYYPQGKEAMLLAAGEHATRVMTLYRMKDELEAIAEKIAEQGNTQ